MLPLTLVLAAFSSGSLPWSVWIGRLALGVDIRRFGDHNPGATNVLRAGGRAWAVLAVLMDGLKGALPVALARPWLDDGSPWLAAVACAPVLGHAFTPWLGGRGGKAVAVTFGVWAGLTAYEGPVVLGLGLALGTRWLGANGRAVLASLGLLLAFLLLSPRELPGLGLRPPLLPTLLMAWIGNTLVVAWKHRGDLVQLPRRALEGRIET